MRQLIEGQRPHARTWTSTVLLVGAAVSGALIMYAALVAIAYGDNVQVSDLMVTLHTEVYNSSIQGAAAAGAAAAEAAAGAAAAEAAAAADAAEAAAGAAAAEAEAAAQPGPVQQWFLLEEEGTYWDYKCWTPHTMSSPSLTIASVVGGLAESYLTPLRKNRLLYSARHGYRYCELYTMDAHRIPAWSKLPWMMALAPCSEYLLHVDADAMLYNHTLSARPIMDYMEATDTDQLLSTDSPGWGPVNFGVFMTRMAPWVHSFYKHLYNTCACDRHRLKEWPAEQGIIYNLLAADLNSTRINRTRIVSSAGWNHMLTRQGLPEARDLIAHFTMPQLWPADSGCESKEPAKLKACKYISLEHILKQYVSKAYPDMDLTELLSGFTVSNQTCLPVRSTLSFSAAATYTATAERHESSILEDDVNPRTGALLGVKVVQIGCSTGHGRCGLNRQWDMKNNTGPWMPLKDDVMQGAPPLRQKPSQEK